MNHQAFHSRKDWETLEVTSINRSLSHASWGAYESTEQAAGGDRTASKWTACLDGTWKFACKESPEQVESFWSNDFQHENWSDIQVPGNWELQGFGEPIYTNTLFPWNHFEQSPHILRPRQADDRPDVRGLPNPPVVPEKNPTGCYFRTFEIPDAWQDRRVFLHFKGVETAYYLWINGQPVGYSEDSKLPSEFDITDFLLPGQNTVALQVMRFATSTYLEDQDYWYLSGIFRSVYLYAKPGIHLTDWKIDAFPELHHPDGKVQADIQISRVNGFADHRARLELLTMDNQLLATGEAGFQVQAGYRMVEQPTGNTARIQLSVQNITAWTPETPVLYKAVITLLGPDGMPVDMESCRIGFKRVQIQNGILLLNGNRLLVRGVNRHEHEPRGGRAVSRAHMIEEIKQMKRLGINAVRTCHYPDDPIWYDLCDEWGLLTICECNLETHGVMGALTHHPAWGTNFLERALRMVLTHKNHASVYAWSLGNESGTGANHAAMAGWIREYDPTRVCQYEAGEPGRSISDIRGNMYAPQANILKMLADPNDTRPIILVEYLYQIRNAGGGMHHFNDLMERYPRFQGGYIWDWQDKCLVAKTDDGVEYFGYGGDFGESVTDWECPLFMTNNGIVLPDLTPKPVAWEVKQAYCPIQFEEIRQTNAWVLANTPGRFLIRNRTLTTDLSAFRATYTVRENGYVIATGEFPLPDLAAGSQTEASFVYEGPHIPGAEYHVDIALHTATDTAWSKAEEELACFQFRLESGPAAPEGAMLETVEPESAALSSPLMAIAATATPNRMQVHASGNNLIVKGDGFEAVFSTETGKLQTIRKNGTDVLLSGPSPCFSRPPCGIDAMEGWGRRKIWKKFDEDTLATTLKSFRATPLGIDRVLVETSMLLQLGEAVPPMQVDMMQTVCADGTLEVRATYHLDASLGDLPRIGMEMAFAEGYESLEYHGKGPGENYRDRQLSARLGVFKGTVTQEHFPFIPPSETGGHEQTRWMRLARVDGESVTLCADVPFHFDARHNSIADYRAARHDHELIRRPETWVHLDAAHAGIGSDMGWSTFLTEEDQVKAVPVLQAFRIVLSKS